MSLLDYVLGLLEPDKEQIETGRRRQAAVWEGVEPDYTPILLPPSRVPERAGYPSYNLKEQFYDPEKMLIEHVWGLIGQSRSPGDAQLAMRANLGTGFVPTTFGLEQLVFEDKMPWLKEHLDKATLQAMTPDEFGEEEIRTRGLVPCALEYIGYFKEKLGNKAYVYLSDTQGPFDIAHLVYGDRLFTDLYDDPEFVHHLMRLSTRAYISVSKVLKDAIGEPMSSGYHGNIYMGNGGVRCCEDTTTLLSPQAFREFVAPYIREALQPFGGGWVHFCGNGHQFLEELLDIPEVKGINFGNPERYDYEATMDLILERGKFYVGTFPTMPGEGIEAYFRRILQPLKKHGTRKGLIFMPQQDDSPEWQEPGRIVELWHELQTV